jgi:hypothetical protein
MIVNAEIVPAQLTISSVLSAFSMSSLKLFCFIFNLRDVSAIAPKAIAGTSAGISALGKFNGIGISLATFYTP